MAGKLIVDTIDTDNAFITLNVQQSQIATMNVSGIYSNTGVKMIGANGTVSNTAITGNIISSQITSVANTQITGNIISSQITSVANTQITGNITSSQITSNPTLYGNVSVTGVIAVGGATPTTNGSGITFPATQSASTNANTLDDYEEGTWTPVIKFGGNSVGQTYSGQTGVYVKIGQIVLVQMNVGFTNKGSSTGSAKITGLPFTQNDTTITYPTGTFAADGGFSGISSNGFGIYGLLAGNEVYIRYNGSTGGYADLYDTNFSNTSAMYYSLVYRASA
jgi:hypothetical protein